MVRRSRCPGRGSPPGCPRSRANRSRKTPAITCSRDRSRVANADLSIRARAATPELRRTLRLRGREPLIALERVSYDVRGAPIEYTLYWANAETYEFVLRLRGAVPITSSMQGIK
ncbi:MAG: UTRA domain-containing protein [Betaproteobacteria bacterium]|nr:UTRA domain-containing protein [Betaproteobacteria bacterium]